MIRLKLIFSIGLLLLCAPSFAQKLQNTRELQVQIKKGIANAYASSVRIYGFDTTRKAQNSSQFTGVVVGKDGTILTVAHATIPNRTYRVRFPDGREAIAKALGRIGFAELENRPDLGMLKIIDKGDWPVAEMSWSHSLKINQPCISIAYPETLNQLLPTVRFGRIKSLINEWGFLESTCKMEPGDSGGPLFDDMGRVIGMHSRCGVNENDNLEVPVDFYRKYWTALQTPQNYMKLPADTSVIGEDPMSSKNTTLPFLENMGTSFASLASSFKESVAAISSTAADKAHKELATVFNIEGKCYLVSKSSMVFGKPEVIISGKNIPAKVIARDEQNDLVLLQVPVKSNTSLKSVALKDTAALAKGDLGTFLISPVSSLVDDHTSVLNDQRISVLSSMYIEIPKKINLGYMGAYSMYNEGKIKITRILKDSPAELAGLKSGDEVLKLNNVAVKNADQYNQTMMKFVAGDSLYVTGLRDGQSYTAGLLLTKMPASTHAAEQFEGGKSARLDGFKKVFAHDAIIKPEECGGPVYDSNGRFYGINIARFSRTSVLVIPAHTVFKFLKANVS